MSKQNIGINDNNIKDKNLSSVDLLCDEVSKLNNALESSLFKNLSMLDELRELSRLSKLDNLEKLSNLSALEQLEALNRLSSLDQLKELNKLDNLTALTDLNNLSNLTKLSHLDKLENLNKIDELNTFYSAVQIVKDRSEDLQKLNKLDQLTNLENLASLSNLSKLENLASLSNLDRLNNLIKLDSLAELEKLNLLTKLDELKSLSKLDNLNFLENIDKLKKMTEDGSLEKLDKLDKIDILNREKKKIIFSSVISSLLDFFKIAIISFILVFFIIKSNREDSKIAILSNIALSETDALSLTLPIIRNSVSTQEFGELYKKISTIYKNKTASFWTPRTFDNEKLDIIELIKNINFKDGSFDLTGEINSQWEKMHNDAKDYVFVQFDRINKDTTSNERELLDLQRMKNLFINNRCEEAYKLSRKYKQNEKWIIYINTISLMSLECLYDLGKAPKYID